MFVTIQSFFFFFFNDTATTEIYTLSLHDALPILRRARPARSGPGAGDHQDSDDGVMRDHRDRRALVKTSRTPDRKSTRLNSSHGYISYAVFCLKKKKTQSRVQPAGHETNARTFRA